MKTPLKFLLGASAGLMYGLIFSQKSGKKLRTELHKSKEPLKILWNELKKVFKDSQTTVEKKAEQFDIEPWLKHLNFDKEPLKSLLKQAKQHGAEALSKLKDELKEFATEAEKVAEEAEAEIKKKQDKPSKSKTANPPKRNFKNKIDEQA